MECSDILFLPFLSMNNIYLLPNYSVVLMMELFGFNLFLHINKLSLTVVKFVLQESERL